MDADLRKLDYHALTLAMVEAVYPKHFTSQELRQLAAYYTSPGYQKMAALMRKVQDEHARTGTDMQQLWTLHGKHISAQEHRQVAAFLASPLAKKQSALGERVRDEGSEYVRREIAPMFATAAAAHRKAFLEKMAEAQSR